MTVGTGIRPRKPHFLELSKMTLKKIDHEFKHAQLKYDATPNVQPCIKLAFWFNKLPHVSDEQFHRHWETVHADLTVAAKDFNVCKIQRYVQVRTLRVVQNLSMK